MAVGLEVNADVKLLGCVMKVLDASLSAADDHLRAQELISRAEGRATGTDAESPHLHGVLQIGRGAAVSVRRLHHPDVDVQAGLGGGQAVSVSSRDTEDVSCASVLVLPLSGDLSEQLLEEAADQSGNFVPVQQVEAALRVGVVVNDPVGVSVKGAGSLAGRHREA